jgi:hypothetical protein
MQNLKKSEKPSRGVVILARNTDLIDYVSIAEANAKLIERNLKLPTTIITSVQEDYINNKRYSTDQQGFIQWKNGGRFEVYSNSPYDETILLDADYLMLDNSFECVFDTAFDYKLVNKNQYITNLALKETMGTHSLPFVWATAIFFRKSEKTKMLFDFVKTIQQNYSYYRALYNIPQSNYRNDYAFAIAHYVLSGYCVNTNDYINWPIITADGVIDSISLVDNSIVIKSNTKSWVIPKQNLHVMSKAYLQSENFKQFIKDILNA